jgi:hypothetical protein
MLKLVGCDLTEDFRTRIAHEVIADIAKERMLNNERPVPTC